MGSTAGGRVINRRPMQTTPTPRLRTALSLVGAIAATLAISAQAPTAQRAAMQAYMRQKLASSQTVLEGLTLERFEQVQKGALSLRKMTQTNAWSSSRNVNYLQSMTNYQANLDVLWQAAADNKLEAATQAYAKVVQGCVECHRVVRLDQHLRQVAPTAK